MSENPEVLKHSLKPLPGMQEIVAQSDVTEVLMGGQAGPGKTWLLLYDPIRTALEHPQFRCLFLRRISPELGDMIDKAIQMYSPFGVRFVSQHSYYNKPCIMWPRFEVEKDGNGKIISLKRTGDDGAIFVFGHCQQEKDKFGYGGFEFQQINFDEVANFLESQYLFLFSRLRTLKDPETGEPLIKLKVRASCNPVGVGMLWVKRRFVSKLKPGEVKWFKRVGGMDLEVEPGTPESIPRMWVPGDRRENSHLDESYEGNLAQLDEKTQRALKLGLWDIEDEPGQLFSMKWFDTAAQGEVPLLPREYMDVWGHGVDYATDRGTDTSVLISGPGNRPTEIRSWKYTTEQDMAWLVTDAIARSQTRYKVGVDANGAGHGVATLLESGAKQVELRMEGHVGRVVDIPKLDDVERCVEKDKDREKYWNTRAGYRFRNVRAQMYWQLKDDLEQGRIDLSALADPENDCSAYEKLIEEAAVIKYRVMEGGWIWVESKEVLRKADRLGRSPDFIDALVYWNWVRPRMGDILPPPKDGPWNWNPDHKKDFEEDEGRERYDEEPSWI